MQPSTFAVLLLVFFAATAIAFPSHGYSKSGRHGGGGYGSFPWYGGGGGGGGGHGSYKSYIAIADKYLDHNDGQRYISQDYGYGGQDNSGYDNGYDNRGGGGGSHGDYGYGTHQEPVLYKK